MKGTLLHSVRRIIPILLILLSVFARPTPSYAHGGVIIDTGYTDHFEWMVSIDPFPTLLGEATITLLVYDIATYEPMNDLTVSLLMAAPDAPRPCCEEGVHTGPIPLTIDPDIYPGDYSNVITFDQPGEWRLQFVATAPETLSTQSFELLVSLPVNATMGGSQPIPIEANSTPDIDATATVFAQNVAAARQSTSPLAAAASPLGTPDGSPQQEDAASDLPVEGNQAPTTAPVVAVTRTTNWWLWGGLGLVPIVLIGWFILGSSPRDKESSDS